MFKTRSQATRACTLSRVRVNAQRAKAHRQVVIGDRVEIEMRDGWTRVLVVKKLADKPLPKAMVPELFDDESPPKPTRDKFDRIRSQGTEQRERGLGRPTKRDRRRIEKLRDR